MAKKVKGKAAAATDGAELLGGGGGVSGLGVAGAEGVVDEGPPALSGGAVELGGGVAGEEGVGTGLKGAGAGAALPPLVTLMASFWPKVQC